MQVMNAEKLLNILDEASLPTFKVFPVPAIIILKQQWMLAYISAVKTYNFPTHKGFCHNFPTQMRHYRTRKSVTKASI